MARYVDPNSGAAPQPGGSGNPMARRIGSVTPETSPEADVDLPSKLAGLNVPEVVALAESGEYEPEEVLEAERKGKDRSTAVEAITRQIEDAKAEAEAEEEAEAEAEREKAEAEEARAQAKADAEAAAKERAAAENDA